jgi:hypothetical protein
MLQVIRIGHHLHLDFSELFSPGLIDEVGCVLLDGLEGSCCCQGREVLDPTAALNNVLAGKRIAKLSILRDQAHVLVDETWKNG